MVIIGWIREGKWNKYSERNKDFRIEVLQRGSF